MKKLVVLIIVLALTMAIVLPVLAYQETRLDVYQEKKLVKSVVFAIGLNTYFVNNKPDGVKMDAKPFIQEGRTFVPIRFLSNALGVEDKNIFWDQNTRKVTLMAWNRVEMAVDSPAIAVKTPEMERPYLKVIDVSPILNETEGRTYLPARYVAEALGYEVDWDEKTETVLCWPKGEAKPDVAVVKQKVMEERKQPEQKPMEQETLSKAERAVRIAVERGYTIPTGLKALDGYRTMFKLPSGLWVEISPPEDNPTKLDLGLLIPVGQGTERMREDARAILASKFGPQLAKEMIDYASRKVDADNDLLTKYWRIIDQPIRVGSKPGDIGVDITIWESGVKLGI